MGITESAAGDRRGNDTRQLKTTTPTGRLADSYLGNIRTVPGEPMKHRPRCATAISYLSPLSLATDDRLRFSALRNVVARRGLNDSEGFDALIGSHSLAGLGHCFPNFAFGIFKTTLDSFGKHGVELVDATQHMGHHRFDGKHFCRENTFSFNTHRCVRVSNPPARPCGND
jgi:hypothetical protein